MINPPLASTAVGVVEPQRAGMASGINSTFRQVGIATGIALLGTLFSSRTHSEIVSRLAHVSGSQPYAAKIALGLRSGEIKQVIGGLPANLRGPVEVASRGAFTAGLDHILLVAAIVALACGVIALLSIRTKDFVSHESRAAGAAH